MTSRPDASPSIRSRVLAAAGVGAACLLLQAFDRIAAPDAVPDFDHVWFAATALLDGRDPYALIGPGREYNYPWPLYYPLTAPASILPLGALPLSAARALFVAVPASLLAFLLSRHGFGRLAFFASGAWLMSVKTAQWGPIVVLGLLLPWFGAFCAAKPNLGLGVLAAARSKAHGFRMAAGATAVLVISLVLQPAWPVKWLEIVRAAPQPLSMLSLAGGPLLLLAALRWRRWEARMLLVLALVPQTSGAIGNLPLLLVPRSLRSLLVLCILSYVPAFVTPQPGEAIEHWARRETFASLFAVYLPTLWLILRMPNSGPLPARLESVVAHWPAWMRGTPGVAAEPASLDVTATGTVPSGREGTNA